MNERRIHQLSLEDFRPVDEACEQFESAWKSGRRLEIPELLQGLTEPRRSAALQELLLLELDFRADEIPPPSLPELESRFPEDTAVVRETFAEVHSDHDDSHEPLDKEDSPAHTPPLIPGYEILKELGSGGMGAVYLARDMTSGQRVAVKTLFPNPMADFARFRREVKILASIEHPNIVSLKATGDCEGRPYFIMELCEGGDLRRRMDETTLEPRNAARTMEALARAMHEVHKRNIVHRDLKPSNVLLDANGVPKIGDFGLARRDPTGDPATDVVAHTETGQVLGSPSYMSPEQARGESAHADAASDVYGLGAVFYFLLTGRPPFQAATRDATIELVKTQDPAPPRRLNSALPRDAETICLKCLEKNPRRRYANATELADDLGRFLNGEPIIARPALWHELLRKWIRRHPRIAAAIALTIIVSLTAMLVNAQQASRERGLREIAEEREQTTQRHLYDAQIERIPRTIAVGQMSRVRDLLDATRPANTGNTDFRGWEWYYLYGECRSETTRFEGHAHPLHTAVYSPDGRQVASADTSGAIVIWDAETGRETKRLPGIPGGTYALAFDSQARRIAAAGADCDVIIYELTAEQSQRSLVGHVLSVHHLAFSPDGELLATAGNDNTVKLWDLATGRERLTLLGHKGAVRKVWFSRDGAQLASHGDDKLLFFWSLPDGKQVKRLSAVPAHSAVSHDMQKLAIWNRNQQSLQVVDVASKKVIDEIAGQTSPVREFAFSADDKRLAIAFEDGDAVTLDWTAKTHSATYRAQVRTIAFSANGDRIVAACTDQIVRIWPAKKPDADYFGGHTSRVTSLAASPRGPWIASGDTSGSIRIWNAETGASVRTLGTHVEVPDDPSVDPDAKPPLHNGLPARNRIHFTLPDGSGYSVLVYEGHAAEVTALAFSRDGQTLASVAGDEARLWHVATGKELRVFKHPQIAAGLALSPDGKTLATGCWDDLVRIWDTATGRELHTLSGHEDNVYAVAFHPNGRWLASAGDDADVRIWDAASGALRCQAKGHADRVNALAFSPDGATLASGGDDLIIRLWNVADAQLKIRVELHGHTHDIAQLAFHPTEDRLVSSSDWSSDEAVVRFWDVKLGREIVALPAPNSRNFGLAWDPTGVRLALTAGMRIQIWTAYDRAKVGPPIASSTAVAAPVVPDSSPEKRSLKVLGWYRADRLPQHLNKTSHITPTNDGESFWLAVVSLPYAALYPTESQYEHLRRKSVEAPTEAPSGPRNSYALFDPSRFALHPPQGEPIRATAVAPLPWPYTDGIAGFSRGICVEMSTSTMRPRDRSLMAVAFPLPADQPGPLRIRFDNQTPVETPELELKNYRGEYARAHYARDKVNPLRLAQQRTFAEY